MKGISMNQERVVGRRTIASRQRSLESSRACNPRSLNPSKPASAEEFKSLLATAGDDEIASDLRQIARIVY
jgi:hypothetical protein